MMARTKARKIIAAVIIIVVIVSACIFEIYEKGLEAFRSVFLWTGLASEFAVGVGICIESWPPKSATAKIAFLLIVPGVVLGAVCTILLFHSDEMASLAQQSKIIMLEKSMASRSFDTAVFLKRLIDVPKKPIKVLYAASDPDSFNLAEFKIGMALTGAGWADFSDGAGIPKEIEQCGASFGGVSVIVGRITQAESEDFKQPPSRRTSTPWAMADALGQGLGDGKGVGLATCPYITDGMIRIVVSKRPPQIFPK